MSATAAPPRVGAVPAGHPVVLDRDVRRLAGGDVLLGGDPGRLVRLRRGGAAALEALARGDAPVPVRELAVTLLDGGLAHPRPRPAPALGVVVVVPVRDRADELGRCLAAVGRTAPVLVVDDGSRDPAAVAAVAASAGARLLRLPVGGGPAAARNAGLAASGARAGSALVALLDSDCTPPPGWLDELVGHFDDPRVGAVAPRVRARPGSTLLSRYAAERGPLDLGAREAPVRPGGRVPYVPTAALVVRREALGTPAFDPALRYGEDVDLVWRLHDRGWRVRYDPRTVVTHDEPGRWGAWLARRQRYGTSAAPLAARHGARLAPLVLPPWTTATWLLLLSGRPGAALVVAAVPAARLARRLRRTGLARTTCAGEAVRATGQGVVAVAGGLGGAGAVVTAPVLLALLAPRRTRRGAVAALLAPPLLDWLARRPALDPVRWTALRLLDDLAYASGVWRGCWSGRTAAPLRPRVKRPR